MKNVREASYSLKGASLKEIPKSKRDILILKIIVTSVAAAALVIFGAYGIFFVHWSAVIFIIFGILHLIWEFHAIKNRNWDAILRSW